MSGFDMFMYALAIIAVYRGDIGWALLFFVAGVL